VEQSQFTHHPPCFPPPPPSWDEVITLVTNVTEGFTLVTDGMREMP